MIQEKCTGGWFMNTTIQALGLLAALILNILFYDMKIESADGERENTWLHHF